MLPATGFLVFAKRDCPTCTLIEPVLRKLSAGGQPACFVSQDDPLFPEGVADVVDDRELEQSFRHNIEIVPTLIRMEQGREVDRTYGWDVKEWRRVTGISDLGRDLPEFQPGCGSLSVAPGAAENLQVRYGETGIKSRKIELGEWDDPIEACFERGWSDGLPVVPPTDVRILRMLAGTHRKPDEVIGRIPPFLPECSVEKVAIAAVMAGCKPEYMPLVLAVVETALVPLFSLHGILATTSFGGPIVIVNGPIAKKMGMNWGFNALGQGNRANNTIGRALQLLVRNFGGGRPGEVDRAALGSPGKITFCFAEDETDPEWEPYHVSQGFKREQSAVTLFQGHGVETFHDDKSRTPEQLAHSFGLGLRTIGHPRAQKAHAVIVLSPEHYAIFRDGGWGRKQITEALHKYSTRPGRDIVAGTDGIPLGIDPSRANEMVPKFAPDGLLIIRAGGPAGLFSGILPGWGSKPDEVGPVTREVRE
jgi:hypothetical protein